MKITIEYSPELNIYTVSNGLRVKTHTEKEIPAGLGPVFLKAKEAVISGKAVMGIHVEV